MNEPFHFIVRFTPKEGRADDFRRIMVETAVHSRAEADCVGLEMFESLREPKEFSLHSVWTSEDAFEHHATLPHTERFIEASRELLTHEIKGMRLRKV